MCVTVSVFGLLGSACYKPYKPPSHTVNETLLYFQFYRDKNMWYSSSDAILQMFLHYKQYVAAQPRAYGSVILSLRTQFASTHGSALSMESNSAQGWLYVG